MFDASELCWWRQMIAAAADMNFSAVQKLNSQQWQNVGDGMIVSDTTDLDHKKHWTWSRYDC